MKKFQKHINLLSHQALLSQFKYQKLHGPSMFAFKAKIHGVFNNLSSSIAFDETSSYWFSAKKLLISQLFIGNHMVVWFPLVSFL